MQVQKAIEISNAKIQFVSLVDKAANLRQFLITKAENGRASFSTYGKIVKVDDATHYITGIVYEPLVEDAHGNFMTEDEIRKAAFWFAKNGDKVDIQHSFEAASGVTVVETYIALSDMQIGDELVAKGTWLMTVEVSDPAIWEAVEKGEVTGFSMGGMGIYSEEDVDLDSVTKTADPADAEKKGFFKKMADFFGYEVVEKGAMADAYADRAKYSNFWDAFYTLEDILYRYDYVTGRYELISDDQAIREALADFTAIVTDILAGQNITKALSAAAPLNDSGRNLPEKALDNLTKALAEFRTGAAASQEKEDNTLTKQEMQEMIDAAVQKAVGSSAAGDSSVQPESGGAGENPPATVDMPSAEDIQKMIEQSVEKAMAPLLQTRGVASNLNSAGQVEKSEPHYLAGIL